MLHQAIEAQDPDWVKALLLQKAHVDVREAGWTPLMKAAEDDQVELMEFMLMAWADLNATSNTGRTALSLAAAPSGSRSSAMGAMSLLLELRAEVSLRDHNHLTALQWAGREMLKPGRTEAIDLLRGDTEFRLRTAMHPEQGVDDRHPEHAAQFRNS